MAEKQVARLDLCKGFRAPKLANLAAPLNGVMPVGLGSLGCFPLVAHHRLPDDGGLLSVVNQQKLTRARDLLDVADEPSDDTNTAPQATPGVAGLRAMPLTGVATLPYPAADLTYVVEFDLEGVPQYRDTQPFLPASDTINSDGRSATVLSQATVWRDIVLGGPTSFNGRSTFLPYHAYVYGMTYILCPNGEPTILRYEANTAEYHWPNRALGEGRLGTRKVDPLQPLSLPAYNVRIVIWEATPAFAEAMSGELLEPGLTPAFASEANGPSLARKYVFHPFQTATMPEYGGTYTATHALTGARSNLTLWTSTNVNEVVINGDSGSALPGSAPASILDGAFFEAHDPYVYPGATAYVQDPFETVFSVEVTAFGTEVFDFTTSPIAFSLDATVPRWYEGLVLAFVQTV